MVSIYIDTHTHIDHRRFDSDRKDILQKTKNARIDILVNPAIDFESNYTMREKLDPYNGVYYGVGIHPNRVGSSDNYDEEWEEGLVQLACKDAQRVVAIGETGLDFSKLPRNDLGEIDETGVIMRNRQCKWFRKQIKLASMVKLPLILHVRNADAGVIRAAKRLEADMRLEHIDAHKEAIKILKEFQDNLTLEDKGVVHCFTSKDYEDAKAYIEMGYLIGIGGAVTRIDAVELREIVKQVPLECIVLETDCPFVLPEGIVEKRNTPLSIPYIAKVIAEIKGIGAKEVAAVTTANAKRVFRL